MARESGIKNLTESEKEAIIQLYGVTGNAREVARTVKRHPMTVYRVLKKAEEDGLDIKEARAEAARDLAGRAHMKAEQILDTIEENDLETGYFEVKDKDGKVVDRKYYGPSLMQKATAFGIITDKANVLQQYEQKLNGDVESGQLMMPGDIPTLINAVKHKVKELSILNVKFEDDQPELVRRTEEVLAEAHAVENADFIDMDGNA